MRMVLSYTFSKPVDYWSFVERQDSTPLITNLPGNWYYSLSHSKGLMAFALGQYPVGIDVELIKKRDFDKLAEYAFNADESDLIRFIPEKSQRLFYRVWCAKEGWYKALQPKQQAATSMRDLSYLALVMRETPWRVYEKQIFDYQLSLVTSVKLQDIVLDRTFLLA
ncbi:4'-phosphopantetheinyl transferase superfamily protein [Motiliproteus sp. MSK22-1]|uniref:4'-phosphopantetheinyl transferase family protein n=1 Tax=Motiliproteus sp. MSK22-1 TaxID=1897630 RepID=UPI00097890A9|nr:4'-phosphopantetheinyl transferase superfamily protein [Motiliproteus sp. MSK22-1]OMH31693.1 hypothetical protein BGP75_16340 [Motiliproteus sp. MSK22-1]